MRLARLAFATLLISPLLAAAYTAPLGGSHAPPVPPPPGPPPGDTTGGTGGGARPGPSAPGPSGPSNPGPSGPSAPKGPDAPGGPESIRAASVDISDWVWWWNYNKAPYLQLKSHVLGGEILTGSDEFFIGSGQESAMGSRLPSDEAIGMRIGPALQGAIESGSSRMQSDALIAIAKLHPTFVPQGKSMAELIRSKLGAGNQKTAESAIVALGLMGDARNISILAEIAADSEAGRKYLNVSKVPGRTRPLAALALGVMGPLLENQDARRMIVARLSYLLGESEDYRREFNVACITAIGMNPLPASGRILDPRSKTRFSASSNLETEVQFLLAILTDRKRDEGTRAHIPKALASLLEHSSNALRDHVKTQMLDELKGLKRSDRLVRYGLIQGLGRLGDSDAQKVDKRLRSALHSRVQHGDNSERGLALVSIALVSSRRGLGEEPFASLDAERKYLLKYLANGKSRLRTWTALALGLQEYHATQDKQAPSAATFDALLSTYKATRSKTDAGAWSIALGLVGNPEAIDELLERLDEAGDEEAQGFAAVGLGLIGPAGQVEALEKVRQESAKRHVVLHETSVALAMLGQKNVVDKVLKTLNEAKSAEVKTGQLVVLGDVGDDRAVDSMVRILGDKEELDITRSFSATSLGILCESEPLPWTAAFTTHLNYFAMTETLITGKGTGILNLR